MLLAAPQANSLDFAETSKLLIRDIPGLVSEASSLFPEAFQVCYLRHRGLVPARESDQAPLISARVAGQVHLNSAHLAGPN